jgi:hypothetical protein
VPRLNTPLPLFTSVSQAVELHIQFAALERMLNEQLFTQDGRKYVHGSAAAKCNFADLEKPHFRAAECAFRPPPPESALILGISLPGRSAPRDVTAKNAEASRRPATR